MSQPAARLGDMTAHGGALTSGNPTVLIGGQPAATLGDLHVCPLCSPGPHVGGPVMVGAPTVLIGGRPAARTGDPCVCAAPAPDVIVSGCPTVLIGGASGAASPGAAAAAASAAGAALRPGTPGTGAEARPLSPWVGVAFADGSGRPVAGWDYRAEGGGDARGGVVGTGGQVWLDALAEGGAVEAGLVGVYGCRWDRDEARVGEPVGMSARCAGVEDGVPAHFEVWREAQGPGGAVERAKVWEVVGEVRGGAVEAARPFVFRTSDPEVVATHEDVVAADEAAAAPPPPEDNPDGDGSGLGADVPGGVAVYVCEVVVEYRHRARGGALRLQDWVEVEVVDADGRPVRNATFALVLADGTRRMGTADGQGVAHVDGVPPGPYEIRDVRRPKR